MRNRSLDLLEESGPSLYGLLLRLTLREDAAEELMQELFLRLARSNPLDRVVDLTSYAHKSAMNLAFDWRRTRKQTPLSLSETKEPAAVKGSPLVELVEREQLDKTAHAIEQLPTASREVVVMHYVEQRSHQEIAQLLNKPPDQVRALCSKGLNRLRKILGAEKA